MIKAVKLSDGYKSSSILIFTWKLEFYHLQQKLPVVFLEVTATLFIFKKNCWQNIQIWTTILCQFLKLKKKFVLWKKQPSQLTIQTIAPYETNNKNTLVRTETATAIMTTKLTITFPWLVWLHGLSANLQTKRLPVWFPIRAHAWVEASSPAGDMQGATDLCISHTSMFLPPPLSKNK